MTDAIKTLNNIRTLRAQARETDLATLEEMLEKLTAIVEDDAKKNHLHCNKMLNVRPKLKRCVHNCLKMVLTHQSCWLILNLPVRLLFVLLVLLNTNTLMKMVMKRHGQVRVVHQKRLLLHWKVVKL
jgi:predicted methyltransferase